MKKKIYIILFVILYLVVAFSSLWHSIEFFALANITWMAVILAGAFEIGQAAVLFALLSNTKDRRRVMPWVLMSVFTLVQVLGNVYASYKHIMLNSVENLKYFKEPVFIWTDLPDTQATVIITYLVGSVLPISALLLTSMLTSFLSDSENKETSITNKETINEPTNTSVDTTVVDNVENEQGDVLINDVAPKPVQVVNKNEPDVLLTEELTDDVNNEADKLDNKSENKKTTHLVSL